MNDIDSAAAKIGGRNWEKLRSNWLNFIPTIDPPGSPPQFTVSEVLGLQELAVEMLDCDLRTHGKLPVEPILKDLDGLRAAVLCESIYLLHKAGHVIGAAEAHSVAGIRTWALSSAYQGSLFAAKALMGLLGVSYYEWKRKTVVIDLFPEVSIQRTEYIETRFIYVSYRLQHVEVWKLLQRLFRIANVQLWPKGAANCLATNDAKTFARQRNEVHNKNYGWLLADLHEFDTTPNFGVINSWKKPDLDLDFERKDASLAIAFYLLRFGVMLLQDLQRMSNKLSPELELFRLGVERGRHPIYAENILNMR